MLEEMDLLVVDTKLRSIRCVFGSVYDMPCSFTHFTLRLRVLTFVLARKTAWEFMVTPMSSILIPFIAEDFLDRLLKLWNICQLTKTQWFSSILFGKNTIASVVGFLLFFPVEKSWVRVLMEEEEMLDYHCNFLSSGKWLESADSC